MTIENIGLLLAIAALAVGVWHLKELRQVINDAREQTKEAKTHTVALQTQTRDLEEVRQSLSTRYPGQFPQYYPSIVDLLGRAKREIIIFCDFPGVRQLF
jgi:hypothetical protein